jgi:hypothetical protein
MADPKGGRGLQAEVVGPKGVPAVLLELTPDGRITLGDGSEAVEVGRHSASRWVSVEVDADAESQRYSLSIDGKKTSPDGPFLNRVDSLERITFRTGSREVWIPPPGEDSKYRDVSVDESTDRPIETSTYYIDDVTVR